MSVVKKSTRSGKKYTDKNTKVIDEQLEEIREMLLRLERRADAHERKLDMLASTVGKQYLSGEASGHKVL